MIFNIGGTKSGGNFAIPTFDGSHAIFGDEKQGYIECYSSGTLTFPKKGAVDVFVLGSGMIGYTGDASGYGSAYPSGRMSATGGRGGAGAVGKTSKNIAVEPSAYPIVVGASCRSTINANVSSAFGVATGNKDTTQIGGTGAKANCSYVDGSGDSWDSTAATGGGNGTSYPFGETSGVFFKQLGAGGGGGGARASGLAYKSGANGGTIGGGRGGEYSGGNQINCTPGTANTGSGGGGGGAASYGESNLYEFTGGAGGSGIVIVRWGYGAFEIPRFSGTHAVFGTAEKGYIECYSSGTLTFKQGGEVDLFLLGSGLSGANGTATNTGTSSTGSGTSYGGKGGSGAVGKTILAYKANKGSYPVTIGETCYSTTEPNATTAFGQTANTVANNGGNGSYTYAEWGTGDSSKNTSTSGTKGSNGTSFPFGESALNADVDPSSIWYKKQLGAGGGGGGARSAGWKYAGGYAGGTYGGGYGGKYSDGVQIDCTPGEANTGSGGGGGGSAAYGDALYQFEGKPGGSGILIVRWGVWTA